MAEPLAVRAGSRADSIGHVRDVLSRAGALVSGGPLSGIPPAPESAFGDARPVEGDAVVAKPVPDEFEVPGLVGFCDGLVRFSVEGWIGICPVVRASVSAAVLVRQDRELSPAAYQTEDFLVAPVGALDQNIVADLRDSGMTLYDSGDAQRRHPTVDLRNAVQFVHSRRHVCEVVVARHFREEHPDSWLVLDGSLRGHEPLGDESRLLGVIKSHETQYLAGADLEVALTLGADHRTSVFERRSGAESPVYSWYVRLWDWSGKDLLYGLVRIERPVADEVITEADGISRWMLAERTPLAGDARRWDRFLYPVYRVESYLRARLGAWS